jgi:hypothetical protein
MSSSETTASSASLIQQPASLPIEKLEVNLNNLNTNWKSVRTSCSCSSEAYDCSCSKLNCHKCGKIFCERCVENGKYVKSNVSTRLMFICESC